MLRPNVRCVVGHPKLSTPCPRPPTTKSLRKRAREGCGLSSTCTRWVMYTVSWKQSWSGLHSAETFSSAAVKMWTGASLMNLYRNHAVWTLQWIISVSDSSDILTSPFVLVNARSQERLNATLSVYTTHWPQIARRTSRGNPVTVSLGKVDISEPLRARLFRPGDVAATEHGVDDFEQWRRRLV